MQDRIRLTIDHGVADVRLNRPDKMNALDAAMFRAIAEAGARLGRDPASVPWCCPARGARSAPGSMSSE